MNQQQRWVWLDLEMTGLDPECDRIIEMACVVTDTDLNVLAIGPEWVIHQPQSLLNQMDDWNQQHHGDSGLIARVQASSVNEAQAEAETLAFLQQWIQPGEAPLAGNSIGQDRRFLVRYMPQLAAFFHYRNLDVSTLKILSAAWQPEIQSNFKKRNAHRALEDVYESIAELRYYRAHFLGQVFSDRL